MKDALGIFTRSLMFIFAVFAVPVLNAVISLIIKLFNYKTYSWSNFAVSIIAMAVVFIANRISFLLILDQAYTG